MTESMRPSPDKAIDVALAEYKALRDEIVGCFTKQGAVLGLGLAAIGVIFTAAAKDTGNRQLLVVVPPLALVVSALHTAEWARFTRIGQYIRCELWPYLRKQTGYDRSWQLWILERMRRRNPIQRFFSEGFIVPILFAAIALGALIWRGVEYLNVAWIILEVVFVVFSILVPAFTWIGMRGQIPTMPDMWTTERLERFLEDLESAAVPHAEPGEPLLADAVRAELARRRSEQP
ncbi:MULTISPECIES: hypothetical protein [unclassified Rhodococcus (in: high G+C Gram-positive bacteria)]|uniref:hypothetical protein n=1 Tax=unclassified Rhodococcus (in: high G+C Gram-positive bacteria) TaxID=192944 RepID=UPI00163A697A|nr:MULTISPECIES: hypothetical protein [unclassified Rhodococcus (in: high G+C Gram-positive bacteria)]MBC2644394.1 hypothetical protein [Rhodococcus sp. 3A]MBC2897914.1 hypothetical protein [Rhodococcus sp. 4CII]